MKRLVRKADITMEISQGDYVNFGSYGDKYVCNAEYQEEYYWVTDSEEGRFDPNATGWAMPKSNATEIIERADQLDEDFEDDDY